MSAEMIPYFLCDSNTINSHFHFSDCFQRSFMNAKNISFVINAKIEVEFNPMIMTTDVKTLQRIDAETLNQRLKGTHRPF